MGEKVLNGKLKPDGFLPAEEEIYGYCSIPGQF